MDRRLHGFFFVASPRHERWFDVSWKGQRSDAKLVTGSTDQLWLHVS